MYTYINTFTGGSGGTSRASSEHGGAGSERRREANERAHAANQQRLGGCISIRIHAHKYICVYAYTCIYMVAVGGAESGQ